MLSGSRMKISIFKEKIKKSDSVAISIILRLYRLTRNILQFLNVLFGAIIFVLLFPFVIILSILFRKKNNNVFFVGIEHVITKTKNRGSRFNTYGYNSVYYSFESSSVLRKLKNENTIKAPHIIIFDIVLYLLMVIKYRPKYIEIYCEGMCFRQLLYCIVARIFNILNIVILRGELYYFNTSMNKIKKTNIKLLLKICNYIFYRETYMEDILKELKVSSNKYKFDPNKVRVTNRPIPFKKSKGILFLNGFKRWRRIDLFIKSYLYVRIQFPDVEYYCIGARNEREMEYAITEIEKLGLPDSEVKNIHIDYWTDNPYRYYDICSIFVLPADLVYLNFSLLESMERGLIPIVANVEDVEKIINNGINGFFCAQDEKEIAKYIKILLSDDEKLSRMSNMARKTVLEKFDDKNRLDVIIDLINNKYK